MNDGLRWTPGDESRDALAPDGMRVGEVVHGNTGWLALFRLERVDGIGYDTGEEAQAVVEQSWQDEQDAELAIRIADLDARG